ncbi:hypothetical protein C8R44DRAFT_977445 [Mycena epipterygia]|nr:hypothetical protein C8R44DRAFT_977445 [Mycena epipterygia]
MSCSPQPSVEPRLPEDLERRILEIAAFQSPMEIPTLLRIARRTLLWFEPLLYRVLVVSGHITLMLRDRLKKKEAQLWRDGPRHLFLSGGTMYLDPDVAEGLLSKCTALEDLVLDSDPARPRQFLPQLEAMQLSRFSVDMGDFFGGYKTMDMRGPAFVNLTHLLLMDPDLGEEADAEMWSKQLALLPVLTHVAFREDAPRHIMLAVLARCPVLRVLVNVRREFYWHFTVEIFARRLRIEDARFVVLRLPPLAEDWTKGAWGGTDFWVRADNFVEAKRRGEIEATKYWDDDMVL